MRTLVLAALAIAVTLVLAAAAAGEDGNPADPLREVHYNRLTGQVVMPTLTDPAGLPGNGVGPGQQGRQDVYCGAFGEAGRGLFDKDISCDDALAPDNETAIAVNPAKPNLVLAGSNDYQLEFVGNALIVQVPSGWFLSQDGGATWIDGELPMKGSLGGGDPAPAFDVKRNRAVFASLSFVCGQFAPVCSRGNVEVATADLSKLTGGQGDVLEWNDVTAVNGNGSDNAAQQIFLDKEWIAVDNYATLPGGRPNPNYGNYYVTFSHFRFESGAYDESPIWFTRSTNGGKTWDAPVEISGRSPAYCTYQDDANDTADTNGPSSSQATAEGPDDPNACDQDQYSYPQVAPDGTVYVQFDNEQNSAAYELPQRYDSQVMVVKSQDGGRTWMGEAPTAANQAGCVRIAGAAQGPNGTCVVPIHVVNKEDSYDTTTHGAEGTAIPDYPINVDGSTTLTGHQFRMNSAGTLAIGPATGTSAGYRLWTVWDDNCHGTRPGTGQTQEGSPSFVPVTNIDVYYAYSDDGGATWVGGDQGGVSCISPVVNTGHLDDDQFYPWAAADPVTGALSVGWMDESQATSTPHTANQYVFSVTTGTPAGFPPAVTVASAPSNPNADLLFGAPDDSACPGCSTFIGDYNGLAVGSDHKVHTIWTDLRRAYAPTVPLFLQDAFYASIPPS